MAMLGRRPINSNREKQQQQELVEREERRSKQQITRLVENPQDQSRHKRRKHIFSLVGVEQMRESTAVQVLQGESDIVSKGRSSILVSVVMAKKRVELFGIACMAWYGIIMACSIHAFLIVYLLLYHLRIPGKPSYVCLLFKRFSIYEKQERERGVVCIIIQRSLIYDGKK